MMDSSSWNATNVNEKPEECNSSKEREARSLALEKAYVHDVYQQISSHFTDSRYRAWPKVKQFVVDLEPGSVICDVGCGNGKYLSFNPSIYKIGLDRCINLTNIARQKDHEVLICDNLALPFRDECFDAVLSVAVIHHFATTERRVAALQELARVLRIGGRLMVSVWAMEQRHRRFESQDVLVPWNRPLVSSSDDKTSSIERDLNSTTTTTSDDDATHYHAYTQTSDSDSFPSLSGGYRKRGRVRHRGRSIDPACPSSSQSSSDLSSPNESCYSFVRRALQKLAGTKRNRGGRKPWFLQGLEIPPPREMNERLGSLEDDGINVELPSANPPENFMPIELRQLESNEFTELFDETRRNKGQRGIILSNVLYPRRRRTLETTCDIQQPNASPINAQPKSKSLSDLFGLIPVGILRSQKKSTEELLKQEKNSGNCLEVVLSQGNLTDADGSCVNSNGNLDGELNSNNQTISFSESVRHKSVQTDSLELVEVLVSSGDLNGGNLLNNNSCNHCSHLTKSNYSSSANTSIDSQHSDKIPSKKLRPTLVKQKHSISSSFTNNSLDAASGGNGCSDCTSQGIHDSGAPIVVTAANKNDDGACWRDMKNSVRNLPEFKPASGDALGGSNRATIMAGSSFWKQTSLNEDLIFSERLREKEKLKQHIQKQCSLNEELIYKRQENTRWDQMKEAFLNSSNVKCLQLLKNGLSSRFRGSNSGSPVVDHSRYPQGSPDPQYLQPTLTKPATPPSSSSLRHGLVRILQNWKQGDEGTNCSSLGTPSGLNPQFLNSRRGSKEPSAPRRGLFPPFFLRRSSAGSLNLSKGNNGNETNKTKLSPPPHLKRRPSENELLHEGGMGSINGNCTKLLPGVRHVRKLSREEGSDSSKDSSFQSDTSVDSEDSFASVIFIPKAGGVDPLGGGEGVFSNSETRANSTDSDRSPKSPASRLSPPNHVPKSPSPLASEILRRRSPEFSPTKDKFNLVAPHESTKFVFDETVTQDLRCLPADLPLSIKISKEPSESENESKDDSNNSIPVFATTSKNYTFPEPSNEKEDTVAENSSSFGEKVNTPLQKIPPFNPHSAGGTMNTTTHTSSSKSTSTSTRKKVEKIEVLRKPGVLPDTKTGFTRQLVRRSFPKALAVELFNPETDDADTSDTSSSSPNSVSSVVSVVNEPLLPGASEETDTEKKYLDSRSKEEAEEHLIKAESLESEDLPPLPFTKQYPTLISMSTASLPEQSLSEPHHREGCEVNWRVGSLDMKSSGRKSMSTGLLETATTVVSSLETLVSHSSPKTKRKLTLARLGTTSEWLSSLPMDISGGNSSSALSTNHKRSCGERRHAGEKMLLGEVKKFQPKGPDAKWPSCIMDDSPPQTAKPSSEKESGAGPNGESSLGGGTDSGLGAVSAASTISQTTSELTSKLIEEMEEKDSLFDSLENLNLGKLEPSPSRNPSIDSSVRMSSTCSCSIRGGDSFDSWTSAKSSLTNSSSTHNKTSLSSIIPVQVQLAKPMGYGVSSSTCGGKSGKGSGGSGATSSKCSAAGVDSEDSTALTYHRYYHVFREGELDKLIEKYVQNLHIISSYYDHANWCIVAEKVQVWTI